MRFLSSLFGVPKKAAHPLQPVPAPDNPPAASQLSTRCELLRVVLRDTLIKHGIPTAWVGAEMVQAMGRAREPGMHLRLLVRHWEPRLLTYGVAFERSFAARLMVFDPLAVNWLAGVSWQFALTDEGVCPALPEPSTWNLPAAAVLAQAVRVAKPDARAELDRQFAQADARKRKLYADDPQAPGDKPNFEATQPLFRSTEPAPL